MTYSEDYLAHYGVKGMKWGVRRYQYADGTLTPEGKRHVKSKSSGESEKILVSNLTIRELSYQTATLVTGRQYADGYLKKNTSLKRIQSYEEFEPFAFYATYKKADSDKYMGLFGKNLVSRANAEARAAEKKFKKTNSLDDEEAARNLRAKADNMKVYQLSINTTKKLRIPSDTNASDVMSNLLKDDKFKSNVKDSIADSKSKMKRPNQQVLFRQASNALNKDPSSLTKQDKIAIYKAFNLSLTNHNSYEIAAQDKFYSELKKKGYSALLDYNDKEYSSYHAKRPVIVFDLDSVTLQSVAETDPKVVDKMYRRYNADRIIKDAPSTTLGYVARVGGKNLSECYSYVNQKRDNYLK